MIQAEGIAHGNGPVTHLKGIGVAQRCHRPRSWPDQPHHGQVGDRIGPHHPAFEALPALEPHCEPIGALHHMGIGEHEPVRLKDHPTALAAFRALGRARRTVGWQSEELSKARVAKEAAGAACRGHGANRVDRDHRRAGPANRRGNEGLTGEGGRGHLGGNGDRKADQPSQPQHRQAGGSGKKNAAWRGHSGRLEQEFETLSRTSRRRERWQTARSPMMYEVFYRAMDTSRLLLAFLAFGAACTTLWAWMLATTGSAAKGR